MGRLFKEVRACAAPQCPASPAFALSVSSAPCLAVRRCGDQICLPRLRASAAAVPGIAAHGHLWLLHRGALPCGSSKTPSLPAWSRRSDVASEGALIWEGFMGLQTPALLFRTTVNLAAPPACGERREQLSTGVYKLQDVACRACCAVLGWKYLEAERVVRHAVGRGVARTWSQRGATGRAGDRGGRCSRCIPLSRAAPGLPCAPDCPLAWAAPAPLTPAAAAAAPLRRTRPTRWAPCCCSRGAWDVSQLPGPTPAHSRGASWSPEPCGSAPLPACEIRSAPPLKFNNGAPGSLVAHLLFILSYSCAARAGTLPPEPPLPCCVVPPPFTSLFAGLCFAPVNSIALYLVLVPPGWALGWAPGAPILGVPLPGC
jgi:hypothetical protein